MFRSSSSPSSVEWGLQPAIAALRCLCTAVVLLGCGSRTELPPAPVEPGPEADLEPPPDGKTNKADILFVVDNSRSMAPHQDYLTDAAVQFIGKLAAPDCVNEFGRREPSNEGNCPRGYQLEFSPLDDFHVGVISSSLGGHGSGQCTMGEENDRAHLVPSVRSLDPGQAKVLDYDGDASALPALQDSLAAQIEAVGEEGCGFEAQLESMYRFLVEPRPPTSIQRIGDSSQPAGIDEELLAQRRAFLRDDSAVFIVLLSDEDDCSAMDGGLAYRNASLGWLTTSTRLNFSGFPPASPACDEDPNDPCCLSCLTALQPPSECGTLLQLCGRDPEPLPPPADRPSLRCFDQKRRFGIDLLYPLQRYVDGLTSAEIVDTRSGELVLNPLLVSEDGRLLRSPNWIFLTTLVGVPWQDLAVPHSLGDDRSLTLLDAAELARPSVEVDGTLRSRWELMVGNQQGSLPPVDPFMVGSLEPRSGFHPLKVDGRSIARVIPPDGAGTNPINGHEFNQTSEGQLINDALQYACIYPLADAAQQCSEDGAGYCACAEELDRELPVCKPTASADEPATNMESYAGARPATRILRVVESLGQRGVPGSICPKITDAQSADYGYRPVVRSLSSRLPGALR